MFEQFTDRARRAVVLAGEYAKENNSSHLTTGHLLMGLLKEGEALPVGVLQVLGITPESATRVVQGLLAGRWTLDSATPSPPHQEWTDGAKLALERSQQEAYKLNVNYIAPEHVLLGLLSAGEKPFKRLDDHVFERAILSLGVSINMIRDGMLHAIEVANKVERSETTGTQREVSEKAYDLVYEGLFGTRQAAQAMLRDLVPRVASRDERLHLANDARTAARLLSHVAETLELEEARDV